MFNIYMPSTFEYLIMPPLINFTWITTFIIILFIVSFIALLLIVNKIVSNNNINTALYYGSYTFLLIGLFGLIIEFWNIRNINTNIKYSFLESIRLFVPFIIMNVAILFSIYLFAKYKDRILSGHVSDLYSTYMLTSNIIYLVQIVIILNILYKLVSSNINKRQSIYADTTIGSSNSGWFIIIGVLGFANIIIINIMNIILSKFIAGG